VKFSCYLAGWSFSMSVAFLTLECHLQVPVLDRKYVFFNGKDIFKVISFDKKQLPHLSAFP
jgi:hypothetical protein